MSTEGELDRDELSAMKVSELRQMCSDRGLLVSGKKAILINRLLGTEVTEEKPPEAAESAAGNIDDAIDKMLARVRGEESEDPVPESIPTTDSESPPVPADGLPPGWTIEQWNHYGAKWLTQQADAEPESGPIEAEIIDAEIIDSEPVPEPEPEPEEDPEDDPWF